MGLGCLIEQSIFRGGGRSVHIVTIGSHLGRSLDRIRIYISQLPMHNSCENLQRFGDNTLVVKYGLKMFFDAVRKPCNLFTPHSDKEIKGSAGDPGKYFIKHLLTAI